MKAYKVCKEDMSCKNFKYKIGGRYVMNDIPVLCEKGFHACVRLINCFSYYEFNPKNRVFLVELHGDIVGKEEDKYATNDIEFLEEITWHQVLNLVNTGHSNSGHSNSGDSNSGHSNSGDWNSGHSNSGHSNSGDSNSGHWNSGHSNSGHSNSGDSNSGHSNSGDWNSGHRNSGHSNSGHRNSGDSNSGHSNSGHSNSGHSNSGHSNSGHWNSGNWNSGDWNSGDWNTITPKKIYFFNKLITYKKFKKIKDSKAYQILNGFRLIKYRVRTSIGKYGDWRYLSFQSSFKTFWRKLTIKEKQSIVKMPYFDKKIFFEITGVKV